MNIEDKRYLIDSSRELKKLGKKHNQYEQKSEVIRESNEVKKLIALITHYKPGFINRLIIEDLNQQIIVNARRSNERIIRQQGLFVIFGLEEKLLPTLRPKRVVIISNKENILKSLENIGVSDEMLFPEIDNVANSIKRRYSAKK